MNDLRVFGRILLCVLVLAASQVLSFDRRTALAQTPDEEPSTGAAIPFLPSRQAAEGEPAQAWARDNSILFLPLVISRNDGAAAEAAAQAGRAAPPAIKLLVDTDPGVDDAVALAWLMTQHDRPLEMLGIVSVAGNTTVANATNNVLLILQKLGRHDVPVVMGAAAPLAQPLSKTSWLIHGPDGLWFLGLQNRQDIGSVPQGAPAFYCATVAANPGLHLLALGPLTNIAQALQQCPDTMKLISHLTILGGAKYGGNKTPVAEFNFWQDPEATDIVLNAGLPITLVLLDAFTQPVFQPKELAKLFAKGAPVVDFLAPAIQKYADVQFTNTGRAAIPDAVAAVIALDATIGVRQPALVKLVLEPSLARGQSVVGLNPGERIAMIASDAELSDLAERAFGDPNFNLPLELGAILTRAADNVQAVTSAPAALLTKLVFPDLTRK